MKTHTVKPGECILSIATENGLFWETLWNLPANAGLKESRKDPFQLVEGDKVKVPDPVERTLRASTGNRHVVRIKGIPASVHVQVFGFGTEPMADEPFELKVGGKTIKGRTTPDGVVQAFVPPGETEGELKVGEGDGQIAVQVMIGHLDPPTEISGVQARLANLGLFQGELDGKESDELTAAIIAFQQTAGLDATGEVDEATLAELEGHHGG